MSQKRIFRAGVLIFLLIASPVAAEPVALDGSAGDDELEALEFRAVGEAGPTTHAVLSWTKPPINGRRYVLSGRVHYKGVEGQGYLEMWSHFGDKGSFFSRTLSASGPAAALSGDSPGREFGLLFDTMDEALTPKRIELNIVLPGPGTVTISNLRWTADKAALLEEPAAIRTVNGSARPAWWSHQEAGLLGAIAGTSLGLLGALAGALGGRVRQRAIVMGALALMGIIGVVGLGAGTAALFAAQPPVVVVPLLGIGALGTLIAASAARSARRRFADLEFRKMRSLDLDVDVASHQG